MGRIMPIRTVALPEGWVRADGAAATINLNLIKNDFVGKISKSL